MYRWSKMVDDVLNVLSEQVSKQRGDHFVIKTKRIAVLAGYTPKPLVCTQVRYIIERLSKVFGMPVVWKKGSHGIWWKFHKYNVLWDLLREGEIEKIKAVAFSL